MPNRPKAFGQQNSNMNKSSDAIKAMQQSIQNSEAYKKCSLIISQLENHQCAGIFSDKYQVAPELMQEINRNRLDFRIIRMKMAQGHYVTMYKVFDEIKGML